MFKNAQWFSKKDNNNAVFQQKQAEFKRQEQLGRLSRIMNKILKVFEEEGVKIPEGLDIVANLTDHLNRDVIRIINQNNKLAEDYDKECKKNNPK
jgi:hypothetical protein